MPARQKFLIGDQSCAELFRGIALVMKMHFNFAEPLPAKLCQGVEVQGRTAQAGRRRCDVGAARRYPGILEQAGIVLDPLFNAFSGLLGEAPPRPGSK